MTAIEYANCTMVARADFGKEAVSAVCTESPNEALHNEIHFVRFNARRMTCSNNKMIYSYGSTHQQMVAKII